MTDTQTVNIGDTKPELIEPDLAFIEAIRNMGGESFKKCFQCSTCAGTCPISPDRQPFPRKEMLWAVWGLKDRLVKNPDIWLCHQCNDCSVLCPRGGNPGDVLAAARNLAYQRYAVPQFMGKAMSTKWALPLLLLLPILLLAGVWTYSIGGGANALGAEIGFPLHATYYAGTNHDPGPFSLVLIDPLFVVSFTLAIALMAVSAMRFWKDINEVRPIRQGLSPLSFGQAAIEAVKEIATHKSFGSCEASKPREIAHLLTMYGCIGLFITTALVFLGLYLFHMPMPMEFYNPIKILGIVSAVAFAAGCFMIAYRRFSDSENAGITNYYDWVFLVVLGTLAVTGILANFARVAEVHAWAHGIYYVHLVAAFFLLAYFPYSKFAHIVYRTLAIIHAKQTRRYDPVDGAS